MICRARTKTTSAFTPHHSYGRKSGAGFTLIEVLVSFAVIAILFAISYGAFLQFQRTNVLNREARVVASIIEEARSQTIFSENDTQYGVHFDTSQVVLFAGSTYDSNNPTNDTTTLQGVTISDVVLIGGTDVVFERITGDALAYGTTTLQLTSNPLQERSIRILPSGIIEFVE